MKCLGVLVAVAAVTLCVPALAQPATEGPPPTAPSALPAPPEGALPAGTVVRIALAQPVSSATSKRGDRFAIRLAQPITSDAGILVPAGAMGVGEVVSAERKRGSGQAGELVLAARYIEYGDRQVMLRGLKLTGVGKDNSDAMGWCKAVFQVCFGGGTDIELPAGVEADAKLAADISMPVIAVSAPPSTSPTATPAASNPIENK